MAVPAFGQNLTANPSVVTFVYQIQQVLPTPVSVAIGSDAADPATIVPSLLNDTAGVFLFNRAGNTLNVGLDPHVLGNLAMLPGKATYSASITVTSPGFSPVTIPLTLLIGSDASLGVWPSTMSFASTTNSSALPQALTLASTTDLAFNYSVAATTTSGNSWSAINPGVGTTPGSPVVSVSPSGLAPGVYKGAVTVTYGGGQIIVPVAYTVQPGGGPVAVSQTAPAQVFIR